KTMTVRADDVKLSARGDGLHVTFRQTFETGRYKDSGDKELVLVRENDALKIAREEMLQSLRGDAPGGANLILIPAKSADDAAAIKTKLDLAFSGVTRAFRYASGFPDARADGLVLGVCDAKETQTLAAMFGEVDSRVTIKAAPGRELACPERGTNRDG